MWCCQHMVRTVGRVHSLSSTLHWVCSYSWIFSWPYSTLATRRRLMKVLTTSKMEGTDTLSDCSDSMMTRKLGNLIDSKSLKSSKKLMVSTTGKTLSQKSLTWQMDNLTTSLSSLTQIKVEPWIPWRCLIWLMHMKSGSIASSIWRPWRICIVTPRPKMNKQLMWKYHG